VSRRIAYSQDKVDSLSTQRSPTSDLGEPLHPIAVSVPGERVSRWHGDGGEPGGSNSEEEEKRSGYAKVMRTNSSGRSRTCMGAWVRTQKTKFILALLYAVTRPKHIRSQRMLQRVKILAARKSSADRLHWEGVVGDP
jgi:hypothetical protein